MIPVFVVNGSNDDVRPETRAVFPETPSLVFQPPLGQSYLQLPARLVVPDVHFRIKNGKMSADDFFGLIALQTFGPGVPRSNKSFRIEHEDGVIANLLHQSLVDLSI